MSVEWAAKVLQGVPRLDYSSDVDLGLLQPKEDGSFIPYADALAAIAKLAEGDGLVERLQKLADDMAKHATEEWDESELVNAAIAHIAALRERVARLEGAGDFARIIGNDDGKDDKDTVLVSYGMLRRLRAAITDGGSKP